jgi:ACT domain-containing protein
MKAIVTVIGKDRVGIIADVCATLASCEINVLDISQTVLQDYFTMIMLVDTSASTITFTELAQELRRKGEETALEIHIQREDIFNAMHRI